MPDEMWNGIPRTDCEALYAWLESAPATREGIAAEFPAIDREKALRALWNRRMIDMSPSLITAVPEDRRKGGRPWVAAS